MEVIVAENKRLEVWVLAVWWHRIFSVVIIRCSISV